MGKACISRFCWLSFFTRFPSELIIFTGNVQQRYRGNIFNIVQCVNGTPATLVFLHAHLADKVFTLPFQMFPLASKTLRRMYAHIVTYAARPTLPQIIPSVDESSTHKLPYWCFVTPGAGTGESSSELR